MAVSNLALALASLSPSTESVPWTRCIPATRSAPVAAASASDATTAPAERELQSTRFVVRDGGAGLVEQRQFAAPPAAPTPAFATLIAQPASQLWSRSDIFWVGKIVSLGNHGTQVFTEFDSGIDHAEFLSGFDETPAAPVWQTTAGPDLAQAQCASAHSGDSHVTIHQIVTANDQLHRQAVVTKYNSSSSAPQWTYTFAPLIGGASRLGMSRDGSVIAAAILNNWTSRCEIAFFGPNSNVPTGTLSLPSFTQLRAFELSSDGSTLYVSSASQGQIIDVPTLSTRAAFALPTSLDCHAISGDGSVVAYGTFGTLVVWERQAAGNYAWTHTHTVPGTTVCGRIDISDDSSTIAFGFNFYDTNLHVRIEALDVPTKTITMSEDAYGTGTLQNVVSDVSISEDGSRFAVALWGDEGDVCPEVRVYNKNSSVPLKLYNLPGSAFDVDLSPDGQRLAVASKQVHANTFASGGTIALYALTREDIRVSGVPHSGSQITVTMRGKPFVQSSLLWANAPAQNPTLFGNLGTLYIQRTTLSSIPTGLTNDAGEVEYVYDVSANAADIGRSVYFQGFFVSPRRFTQNWVKVTILP